MRLLILLMACARRDPPNAPPPPSPTPAIQLSIDGKPLPFTGVFSGGEPGRGLDLFFAVAPVDCSTIRSGRAFMDGEAPLWLTLAPVIDSPTIESWRVVEVGWDHFRMRLSDAEVQASAVRISKGAEVHLDQKVQSHRIAIDGVFAATDCRTQAPPLSGLMARLGPREIPIRSAIVIGNELRIRSGGGDCRDYFDDELSVAFERDRVSFEGWLIPPDRSRVTVGEKKLQLGPRADIRLTAKVGAIPLTIQGTIAATRCDR